MASVIGHMVFSTKYRSKVLVGEIAMRCEEITLQVCASSGIEVLEIAVEADHVHLLLMHSTDVSCSTVAEIVKSRTSLRLRKEFKSLVRWCSRALWAPDFHAEEVVGDTARVRQYIRNQGARRSRTGEEMCVCGHPHELHADHGGPCRAEDDSGENLRGDCLCKQFKLTGVQQ